MRIGYSNIRWLQMGIQLLLNGENRHVVERTGRYETFAEMLIQEDPRAIASDEPPQRQQLLNVIQAIYLP